MRVTAIESWDSPCSSLKTNWMSNKDLNLTVTTVIRWSLFFVIMQYHCKNKDPGPSQWLEIGCYKCYCLVNGSSLQIQIQIQIFHVEGFEIQIQNSAYLNTNINSNAYLTPALPQLCWSVSPCPHPPLWLGTMIMISLFCLSDWWKCCAAAQWQRIIRIHCTSRATGARETWLPGIPHGY